MAHRALSSDLGARAPSGALRVPTARWRGLDVDPQALARHGLVALALLIPLQRATIVGAAGSVVSLVAIVVIPLAMWAEWARTGRWTPITVTPMIIAVALGWWAGATYFWSVNPILTSGSFLRLLTIIAMAVAFLCLSSDHRFRVKLLRAYVIGSVLAGGLVIWQFATTPVGQRFSVNPDASINQVAFTLVLGLVPTAYLIARELGPAAMGPPGRRAWKVVAYGSCYSAITTAVMLSGSRSAALLSVLATVAAVALLAAAAGRVSDVLKGLAAMSALGVLLVSAFSLGDAPPLERLLEADERGLEEEPRTQIWARAWELSGERPLIGWGLGTGVTEPYPGAPTRNPHNTHVGVLLELGAVGMTLWLLLMATTLRAASEGPRLERLMWFAQLAVLFIGVGARGFLFGVPMWLFIGVVSALPLEARGVSRSAGTSR